MTSAQWQIGEEQMHYTVNYMLLMTFIQNRGNLWGFHMICRICLLQTPNIPNMNKRTFPQLLQIRAAQGIFCGGRDPPLL